MDCFQTQRLEVRRWKITSCDQIQSQTLKEKLEPLLTPVVLCHLPAPLQLQEGPNPIVDWIAAREAESDVLLVRERGNDALLGLLILAETSEGTGTRTIHLGYLFSQTSWGKGYATELIGGLIDRVKHDRVPVTLCAGVGRENVASARALEKNGFKEAPGQSDAETVMFQLTINGSRP